MATTVAASGGADGSVGLPTCGTAACTKPHRGGQVGNGNTQNGFAMGGGGRKSPRPYVPPPVPLQRVGLTTPPLPPGQELPAS